MEEKKEKKPIKCSYAVLVIILFAALAFVTDYAYIERKTSKCNCPKCEATNNEVISDNTDNTQVTENKTYSYDDVAGYYSYSLKSETGEWFNDIQYSLYLYDDATFYLIYHNKNIGGFLGNYVIEGNEITLNYILRHISNGAVLFSAEGSSKLIIKNESLEGTLNLSDDLSVDVNISKTEGNFEKKEFEDFIDKFQLCNSTNNYCK